MNNTKYLQLTEQSTIPPDLLSDTAQVYYDTNGDMFIKIHQGGDPGANYTFQLLDFSYGIVPWRIKTLLDGSQAVTLNATVCKCTPDETTIYTTGGGYDGAIVLLMIDNTAGVEISFSTGFTSVTTIETTNTGIQTRLLYYDGTTWREILTGGVLPTLAETHIFVGNSSNEAVDSNKITVSSDVIITLGDSAGNNKLIIKDSGGNVVATINSDGGIVSYAEIGYNAVYDNGNSGSSKTIDWTKGNKQKITTTGSCTLTFTAPTKPCSLQLEITHEASATAYSYTYPASVKWAYKTKFNTSNASGAVDIVSFFYNGTNYWTMGNPDFG